MENSTSPKTVIYNGLVQPQLEPLPHQDGQWQLAYDYEIDLPYSLGRLIIKAGYTTDGASIPKPVWVIIGHPFNPDYILAAIVHDALYSAELVSREVADDVFKWFLDRMGVNEIVAQTMYLAVKEFGWSVWGKHTVESIKESRLYAGIC